MESLRNWCAANVQIAYDYFSSTRDGKTECLNIHFLQYVIDETIIRDLSTLKDSNDYRVQMITRSSPSPLEGNELKVLPKYLRNNKASQATGTVVAYILTAAMLRQNSLILAAEEAILPLVAGEVELEWTVKGPIKKISSDKIYFLTHTLLGMTCYGIWREKVGSVDFLIKIVSKLFRPWETLLLREVNADICIEVLWVTLIVCRYCDTGDFLPHNFQNLKNNTISLMLPVNKTIRHYHEYHDLYHRSMIILAIVKELQVRLLVQNESSPIF